MACISAATLIFGSVLVPLEPAAVAQVNVPSNVPQTKPEQQRPRIFKQDDNWLAQLQFNTPGTVTSARIVYWPKTADKSLPESAKYEVILVDDNKQEVSAGFVTGTSKRVRWQGLEAVELSVVFTEPIPIATHRHQIILKAEGQGENYPLGQGNGSTNTDVFLNDVRASVPLTLDAVNGSRDPLKLVENQQSCVVEVTRNTGVSTWIAQSYYETTKEKPTGEGPTNIQRNHTNLYYRVDGAQGAGAFKLIEGSSSRWVYNALAYNPADGYLYAVSQDRPKNDGDNSGLNNNPKDGEYPAGYLLRISPQTGGVAKLGKIGSVGDTASFNRDINSGITNGTFDGDGNYIFSNNSVNGSGNIYKIKFSGGSGTSLAEPAHDKSAQTVTATRVTHNQLTSANDWAYYFETKVEDGRSYIETPKDKRFIWSLNSDAASKQIKLHRTNTDNGEVKSIDVTGIATPTGQKLANDIYGNAWTYANGNLGFSANNGGKAYQISIKDPFGDSPRVGLVSVEDVPTSYNNDATSNAFTVAEFEKAGVNLGVEKTLKMVDGKPTWTVTVTNHSDCASSGFTVRDLIAGDLKNVTVSSDDSGWIESTADNGTLNWTHGPLAPKTSTSLTIQAEIEDGKCAINKVAVIGNEPDPTPENDVAAAGDCDPQLEIKKYINDLDAQDNEAAAEVAQGGDLKITYVIKNTGRGNVTGIKLIDMVNTGEDFGGAEGVQTAINKELEKIPPFGLDGKTSIEKTITVQAADVAGTKHRNAAKAAGIFDPNKQDFKFPTFNGGDANVGYDPFPQAAPARKVESNLDEANAVIPAKPPVVQNPKFAVEKIGLQAGGVQLQRRGDGGYAYSTEYIVRVRNTGDAEGQFAEVWDAPLMGNGFAITQVTVDGNQVQPTNGRYKVSDPATLPAGATKDFKVVVTGTLTDKAADALPAAVGQCDAVTPQNPGAGSGLVNVVTMDGDSDGSDNNIVCQPVELRRLTVQKRINGYEAAALTPGEETELWYRVINTGNTTLTGIKVADTVKEDNQALQDDITAKLNAIDPFDLAPGAVRDVKITVKAPEGYHANEGRAEVPPTTITGTTNASSTVPGTTLPGITTSATATADTPGISIQKLINGFDTNALVVPGQPMTITYRVANTGGVPLTGISLIDEVQSATTEPLTALQQEINAKLQGVTLELQPGQVEERSITVTAPVDGHVNVAKPTVPPVTIPATTIPGTTIPNVTTVPETTVPERVVTPTTTPSDDASSTPVNLSILKEIRAKDTDEWLDAEAGQPAAVVTPGQNMQIRYTVTNTGKVKLTGIDIVDQVTSIEGSTTAERQALTDALNEALETGGRGFELAPGAKKEVIVTVTAPKGAHVNMAKATAPAVPVTETVTKTIPGTTNATTTVQPKTETTVVQTTVTPPTPTNEARSTPTSIAPPATPEFKVQKTRAQAGNLNLTRNADGKYAYTAEYTIRVTNSGTVDGTHAQVWDAPVRGVGFSVDTVTVDGTAVNPQSGRYLISDGAELKAGEAKDYKVVVSGTVTEAAANALPAAVGQCDAVTPENPGTGSGLVNTVSMNGDADGPANNIVCAPVELRRLKIEKRIDGRPEAVVKPGQPMEIWYRIYNTGNVQLTNVTLADKITENNPTLQQQIDDEIAKLQPLTIEPGAYEDVKFTVTAPKGEHTNVAEARIPETTATATASAKSPSISIKKYVNGHDDGTPVNPGEDMEILYRVTNTGSLRLDGIRVVDQVTQAGSNATKGALQRDINAKLAEIAPFGLAPGEVRDIRITVPAPAGGHVNEAKVSVPPVTIPGTTLPGTTVPSTVVTVTAPPDEGRSDSPQLDIKKFINNRDEGDVVTAGEDMTITYRVTNTGLFPVTGITLIDEVTDGSDIEGLKEALEAIKPFDLAPGAFRDETITVKAPAGGHVNVARPVVPPVTVPGTTIPPVTVPPVTLPNTTVPATTIPSTEVPPRTITPTTTPSDDARSNEVKLEILKDIYSDADKKWHKADTAADAAIVSAGGQMRIRYTVKNTGTLTVKGIDIIDEVTTLEGADDAAKKALTDALNTALEAEGRGFTLRPNESKTVEIAVDAPLAGHVNVAKATAPAVTTLPGSTIPGTTVPGTEKNGTTIPGTTAPEIVVTPKPVTPNTPSNTAQATPTSSLPPVQDPQFVVEKFRAQAANINLERNAEGKYAYSAEYVIRVRNSSLVDGTHAQVWDAPVRGVGFSVDTVTVDGTEVAPQSGRYLVADAAALKANKYKDYRVVVSGTVTDEAANALPAAVGQCDAVTPENPGAGSGLVNTVSMNGDADGPANNIVCAPVELRRLNIEKRIDGRDNAPVTPGQDMEIWYRISNTGNVALTGITLADKITEDNEALQKQIDDAIKGIGAFDLAPGEIRDIKFAVTAPEGEHNNEVRAQVPPTTVPATTRPETTIPGTTNPSTTVPPVTIPGTTLPGTTVPETTVTDTAKAGSPRLEVKKFINGRDVHALVKPGEDMAITYRVTNTGSVRIDGIRLTDQVQEDNAELQRAVDAQLGKVAPFSLAAGESRDVTVTVKAPAGRHDNVVNVTVPPVTIPATTIPGTTVPGLPPVPGTTVPATVVTVTAPPDDAASDSVELAILKEIRGTDGVWRDAETAQDAAPVKADGTMDLRYTVTNTGSVALSGVDIVDEVTELEGGNADELTALINEALTAEGRGLELQPGESKTVEITVKAPSGVHVNVAKATAPAVTTVETVVSSIPGTVTTQTTTVEVTPNTPTNKAQSTPTTQAVPTAQFAVEKLREQAGAINLERREDGSYGYAAEYVVRVRNTGTVDGKYAQIWDAPIRGAGFTVEQVEVEGKAVDPQSGRYLISEPADLKQGASRDFRVKVTGSVTEAAANALPVAVGQCDAVTPENPGAGSGLVNTVSMNGDSDGPANNIVCAPVELRRLNVEKRIDGRPEAVVKPGEPMEIWYRVRNSGNVTLEGVTLADTVTEGSEALQAEITEKLAAIKPFNLAPGEIRDERIIVTAPEGKHVDEVVAEVPPVTTIPGTTIPGTKVTSTATAGSPRLEVKKFINGRDVHALVKPGEDMAITYRVTNTGSVRIDGIRLTDQVQEDNAELQRAVDAQLGKVAPFSLAAGESRDVTVTVKAPAGRHDNVVNVTVPPVTIPATTIPGTTVPGLPPVPGTTVPATVVTVTAPPDDAASDSVELAILKEIKREGEGDDAWRDAETAGDALPIAAGEPMQLRYTVTNTGSVALTGVDVVDNVTRLDVGDAGAFTDAINAELEKVGRGLSLEPGESVAIVITVAAPEGYHVNEAIATAPPVTVTETVVSSIPGTTNETTTTPGSLTTETTTVEVTPNTPTNKAQSTPTTKVTPVPPVTTTVPTTIVTTTPCDCEPTTVTQTPDPVTSVITSQITTVVTETKEPVTTVQTTPVTTTETVTPEPETKTVVTEVTTEKIVSQDPVTSVVTPDPVTKTVTTEVVTTAPGESYTIVIVDEDGTPITTLPAEPGAPGNVTITQTRPKTTETLVQTTTLTSIPDVEGGTIEKCFANAVRSPILYMVPLVLIGQVFGEIASPYVAAINEQFERVSAEINEQWRRKTPDFGIGRRGNDNEQAGELQARIDAANRQIQGLLNDPEVRKYGEWAAIAAGLVVAGAVIYDWCTHEAGEAYTAIGGKGSSKPAAGTATVVVAPVTKTEDKS